MFSFFKFLGVVILLMLYSFGFIIQCLAFSTTAWALKLGNYIFSLYLQPHTGGFVSPCWNGSAWTTHYCVLQNAKTLWTCLILHVSQSHMLVFYPLYSLLCGFRSIMVLSILCNFAIMKVMFMVLAKQTWSCTCFQCHLFVFCTIAEGLLNLMFSRVKSYSNADFISMAGMRFCTIQHLILLVAFVLTVVAMLLRFVICILNVCYY